MAARQNYYLTSNGVLKRKQNTVYFIRKNENGEFEKRILPVNKIAAIYAHGKITFSSGVVSYLSKENIPIHFFNYYGFYESTLYPREKLLSGNVLIKQAEHFLNEEKRLYLAKKFVEGSAENILKNLRHYNNVRGGLNKEISRATKLMDLIDEQKRVKELMAIEGNIWDNYYQSFNVIFPKEFRFGKRSRRPPENLLNSLISFGNSLTYSTVLGEIYHSQLNPTISYLHEPSERRFSLSLDLSEIFKPFIADRVIFKLLNKKIIQENHFEKDLGYVLLNEAGRRLFLEHYDNRLKTTIKHRDLKRKVSYKRIIRLECYKLVKHLLGLKNYEPFTIWW